MGNWSFLPLRTKPGQIIALYLDLRGWLNFGGAADVMQEPRSSSVSLHMVTPARDQVFHGRGGSGPATAVPAVGAHRRVPPGLLPPLAVAHLDGHEEGEEVLPASGSRRPLPLACLYADSPLMELGQQGHQPSPRHCHRGRCLLLALPSLEYKGQG